MPYAIKAKGPIKYRTIYPDPQPWAPSDLSGLVRWLSPGDEYYTKRVVDDTTYLSSWADRSGNGKMQLRQQNHHNLKSFQVIPHLMPLGIWT